MKVLIIDGDHALAIALNSAVEESGIALCFELAAGAEPPAEIMLVPPGSMVKGRDGRAWNNRNPAALVDFYRQRGLKVPLDIEHATELRAPKGESAPAMAWVTNMKDKPDGSVWGVLDWTPKGREMVLNREYSYYSPAYFYNPKTMDLAGVKSIGLTNSPNIPELPALNHEEEKGASPMTLEELLQALGLPAGTTFAAALNHIAQMKTSLATALNHANNPPLDKFVPKADYDLALNRAVTAESTLTTLKTEQLDVAINTEIDAALKAGKITPSTKDYHIANCRQEGGLERFKAFVATAPAVVQDSTLDGKKVPESGVALNAEEQQIADMFGNSPEDLKKYGGV
ncbi:hypothetical protein KI809_10715 [Geobacter pelophilus]|uniref:Mu-like prophage I protein n=1 Tax=Geoanaerobacter pelophilus TaxID=60036 RepID=A0AAW4L3J8_9BACT|nr:phage protease [Geoanaerobacter pelophilus]MBT0664772.1 hypothetical protein [Geoanaerobacter pelophilus]